MDIISCGRLSQTCCHANANKPEISSTVKKIISIFSAALIAGCIVTAAALYFINVPGVELSHYVMLGSSVTLFTGVLLISLDKKRQRPTDSSLEPTEDETTTDASDSSSDIENKDNDAEVNEIETPSPLDAASQATDPIERFVDWLLQPFVLESPKDLKQTESLCNDIAKTAPWLLCEPEFYWTHPFAMREKTELGEVKDTLLQAMRAHWKECALGYPESGLHSIEELLKSLSESRRLPFSPFLNPKELWQERITWLKLAPFFTRLFIHLKEDRSAILPWLSSHLAQWMDSKIAPIEGPIVTSWKKNTPFFFETILRYLLPLNLLLQEDFEGRPFFLKDVHLLAFHGMPDYLTSFDSSIRKGFEKRVNHAEKVLKSKKDILAILNRPSVDTTRMKTSVERWATRMANAKKQEIVLYAIHYATLRFTFPLLSSITNNQEANVSDYLEKLEKLENTRFVTFESVPLYFSNLTEASLVSPTYEELSHFRSTMNTLYEQVVEANTSFLNQQVAENREDTTDIKTRKAQVKELRGAGNALLTTLKTVSTSEQSPSVIEDFGDFVSKSYLISHEIYNAFPGPALQEQGEKWINLYHNFMKEIGIGSDSLKNFKAFAQEMLSEQTSAISNLTESQMKSQMEARKLLPIQEFILATLLLIQGIRHLREINAFVIKHGDTLIELLKSLQIPEIWSKMENVEKYYRIGKMVIGTLANAIMKLGSPFALRLAVSTAFTFIPNTTEFKKAFLKPLLTALLCGVYGDKKTIQTLNNFEKKLKDLFQQLYSINFEEAVQNPEIVRNRLQNLLL